MIGVELIDEDTGAPDADAATAALEETRRRGLLVGKGGLHGNVLRIAPPLTLTAEEAVQGADIVVGALREVAVP